MKLRERGRMREMGKMDKYEFNVRVEQIKKLVGRGDFESAMKIADTIDWRRVRNVSILSMVSSIYEKNEEYQEAKDILLLALSGLPSARDCSTNWRNWQSSREIRPRRRTITGNSVTWLPTMPDSICFAI